MMCKDNSDCKRVRAIVTSCVRERISFHKILNRGYVDDIITIMGHDMVLVGMLVFINKFPWDFDG